MEKIIRIYKIVCLVFLGGIGSFYILPYVFGLTPYVIETKSMEPTFYAGTMIYVEDISQESLKLNDIIIFEKDNVLVTHRVVGIDKANNQITTKGDAVKYNDPDKILFQSIKGKVKYSIPLVGSIVLFIKTIWGMIIGSILFILFILALFLAPTKGGIRNEKQKELK